MTSGESAISLIEADHLCLLACERRSFVIDLQLRLLADCHRLSNTGPIGSYTSDRSRLLEKGLSGCLWPEGDAKDDWLERPLFYDHVEHQLPNRSGF